jgi:cytidylate kinase
MPIITIRGPLGSGAREIGKLAADNLHVDYVDREIIAAVAARLNRQEQEVTEKEMPPSGLFGRIASALERGYSSDLGFEGAYMHVWQIPLDDTRYFNTLEAVIKELARSQSLVIQGRGSQFILRDYPRALHVLITAPLEVRLKRVMERLKLERENAKREITRFDSGAREFIKRYFKAEVWDPVCYDLVLNTDHLTLQAAASIVINALSFKDETVSPHP